MLHKIIFPLFLLTLSSCAIIKSFGLNRGNFSQLKIGMTQTQVEELIGQPNESSVSADGSGKLNFTYKEGYVWYGKDNKLKGFATYSNSEFNSLIINRASGYKFQDSNKLKAYLKFEPFSDLRSEEGKLVFLENRKSIEKYFTSIGYFIVPESEAQIEIAVKVGISIPDKTQELNINSGSSAYTNLNGSKSYSTSTSVSTTTSIEYLRSLQFSARDVSKKNKDEGLIWNTIAVSTGYSEDIRMIFPYLFYASLPLINKSFTAKGYTMAGYHTGVFELVGKDVPRI